MVELIKRRETVDLDELETCFEESGVTLQH